MSLVFVMQYIVTDPVTWLMADLAISEMGTHRYISALLLDGPPGCGKTYLAKYIAFKLKASLLQFQFFPGCGREELLLDPTMIEGKRAKGILPLSSETSQKQNVVVLLDEIDKADRTVDAFLLNFLNEGELFLPQLGKFEVNRRNYIMVITKNDQRDATPALMRRCRCARMRWPTEAVEALIFQSALPFLTADAAIELIKLANIIRSDIRYAKAPSSPELIRLAEDIMVMVKQGISATTLGDYVMVSLAPFKDDLRLLNSRVNSLYVGTLMNHVFGPVAGQFNREVKIVDPNDSSSTFTSTPAPTAASLEGGTSPSSSDVSFQTQELTT